MSSTQNTSLICNNFGGIRRKESSFSDDKITCSDCQNVELYFTNLNSGVGIRTSKGNVSIHDFGNQEVIGIFESNQGGTKVLFVYTEDDNTILSENRVGHLYQCDVLNNLYVERTDLGETLQVTGKACGTDFVSGYNDFFVFTNGKNIIYFYTETNIPFSTVKVLDKTDTTSSYNFSQYFSNGNLIGTEGEAVTGLGLAVFDNKLWIFNGHTLYHSFTGVCYDFKTLDVNKPSASAGFQELTKPITAIKEYLGRLAVFHKDSSCLISQDNTTVYSIGDESPGGCASYDSLVFHGTDLYFYDDTKKGVYAFAQIVNGDKTLTNNIAEDIQEELIQIVSSDVDQIRTLSVVTEDRNEVWFIVPLSNDPDRTLILIFDYIRGEWVKRYSNHINCVIVFEADLYSGGKKLFKEYMSDTFDGDFIDAFYKCSIFNYGTDNTLKITKFPPRLTVDIEEACDFWVEYIRNYDLSKAPKRKRVKCKSSGKVLVYDTDMTYDSSYIYKTSANAIAKLPSTTFKALEINFQAEQIKKEIDEGVYEITNQGFSIKNIEFSKLKIKQV